MVERLSPKETSILKHLLTVGKKEGEKVAFSLKSACKELKLSEAELVNTLRSLSSKGFVVIHRLPLGQSTLDSIYKEMEELELQEVSGAMDEDEYEESRDELVKQLRAFKNGSGKSPPIPMSLNEARASLKRVEDLINRLRKLEELEGKKSDKPSPAATVAKLKAEYNDKLRGEQLALNQFLEFFWTRISHLKSSLEESKQSEQEMRLRYEVGEYDRDQYKRILDEIHRQNNNTLRRITILLAARAEALVSEVPEAVAEELEVLDARKELGEMSGDQYKIEKSKLLEKIRASRGTRIEKAKLTKFRENLSRLGKLAGDLKQEHVLNDETFSLVMNGLNLDIKNLEESRKLEVPQGAP